MTKDFSEKRIHIPHKISITPSNKKAAMSKFAKTGKLGTITPMDNISKMMSDLNATHKTMKLNLTKLKA